MHDEAGHRVTPTTHAVVIAGGGPTGLMLAGEVALARVDVALVERRDTPEVAGSRAGGPHAPTPVGPRCPAPPGGPAGPPPGPRPPGLPAAARRGSRGWSPAGRGCACRRGILASARRPRAPRSPGRPRRRPTASRRRRSGRATAA